ncbi:MAG: hypothetical protein WCJ81_00140 [bacterium]
MNIQSIIGSLSSYLVLLAGLNHVVRMLQGKLQLKVISWALWSGIAIVVYVTYDASGAGDNKYAAEANVIYPGIAVIIALLQQSKTITISSITNAFLTICEHVKRFSLEYLIGVVKRKYAVVFRNYNFWCVLFGILAIVVYYHTRTDPKLAQYSNYLAVIADGCALIPTIGFVQANPLVERPIPWLVFAFGFLLSIGAVPVVNAANLALPLYMFFGSGYVALIQIRYRVKNKVKGKWY